MIVYQVVQKYSDGGEFLGEYRSPLFANEEDAEKLFRVIKTKTNTRKFWWSAPINGKKPVPEIVKVNISHKPIKVKDYSEYLYITSENKIVG